MQSKANIFSTFSNTQLYYTPTLYSYKVKIHAKFGNISILPACVQCISVTKLKFAFVFIIVKKEIEALLCPQKLVKISKSSLNNTY